MVAKISESEELCHELLTHYFERAPMTSHDTEIQCTQAIDGFSINVFRKHIKEIRKRTASNEPWRMERIGDTFRATLDQVDEASDDIEEKEDGHVECEEEKQGIVRCEFNNCFLIMLVPFQWTRPPVTI